MRLQQCQHGAPALFFLFGIFIDQLFQASDHALDAIGQKLHFLCVGLNGFTNKKAPFADCLQPFANPADRINDSVAELS